MTTTVTTTDDGALDSSGAVDPFEQLAHLLPKLAQPSWVRLIGKQAKVTKAPTPSTAAERAMRRNERKAEKAARGSPLGRLARALAGEHTRVRRAVA